MESASASLTVHGAASVLQDGVVVDFTGAQRIVRELRQKLGARLDCELLNCSIAMPAGTESSIRTHQYVAEGAGFERWSIACPRHVLEEGLVRMERAIRSR